MSRLACSVLAVLAFPIRAILGPALAAGPGYSAEGIDERKGPYWQSAKIVAIDTPDQFAGSFSTGIRRCGGSVGMLG